jgi:hypothetical protein
MSTIDMKMPLGRPTLSVWLDVHSRMLMGYAITFEPPSPHSALLSLTQRTPVVPTERAAIQIGK